MTLQSPAFAAGGPIPRRFTGDGRNVSPALSWAGVPETAAELALIVSDADAPGDRPWVHWVLYKVPVTAEGVPEAVPRAAVLNSPAGAFQGLNGWGRLGYNGPAPPKGHGTHHYRFTLFALDRPLNVFHSLSADALEAALRGRTLEQVDLIGLYER